MVEHRDVIDPVPDRIAESSHECGAALLLAVACMAFLLLGVTTAFIIVELSSKAIAKQLQFQGQTFNGADAGLTDALSWFQRQSVQPVTTFAPARNLAATPPVNDTEIPAIGIVRTYPVSGLGNVWGRYEVRRTEVKDVSVQRAKTGTGTIWQLESTGILFRDSNNDSQLTWLDGNGNGVYDKGEPGEVLATRRVRADIQRLSLVLPAGNSAIQAQTCSAVNLTTGTSAVRVLGSTAGIGIGCRSGTGSPTTSGTTVTGTPGLQTNVNPFSSAIANIFGVTQSELVSLANVTASDVNGLPAALPPMSLIVIQGNATFTIARPLIGSGILVVLGNLTIPANSSSSFNGVIYVTGNYTQNAPSLVSGTVIALGNIRLVGASDFSEIDWDAAIVQQIRSQLGGYRFSRSEYIVP